MQHGRSQDQIFGGANHLGGGAIDKNCNWKFLKNGTFVEYFVYNYNFHIQTDSNFKRFP